MKKRSGRKLTVGNTTISIPLIFVLLLVISCGPQLTSTRVLAIRPVSHTSHSSYPNIREIYKSDDEIVLVSTWNPVGKSEGHNIRWEIYNSIGERVHASRDYYATIRPHMSFFHTIRFDERIKNRLGSGTCKIKMYLDDKLQTSQDIEYVKRSIINHHIDGAVILPFRSDVIAPFPIKPYLNTVSNAIYGEVKRIIKDTVPPAVAEERIGDRFYSQSFTDTNLMRSISADFSEDLFITGSLYLGREAGDLMDLTVYVHHSRMQTRKTFRYSSPIRQGRYDRILADLIQGVLYEGGFLDYLRSL